MVKIETINTERFILRQMVESDSESVFKILSDKETAKYLNMAKVNTLSDADALVKDYLSQYAVGEKFPFAITEKDSEDLIGVFLIKRDLYNPDSFEFTVYIKREMWNRGIYSEVLPYMTDFAFQKIGTGNFRGFIMISNKASGNVLAKHGFVLEKTFAVDGLPEAIESYMMTKEKYYNQALNLL